MTKTEKHLLLKQALKLAVLGEAVELERNVLKALIDQGIPYEHSAVIESLDRLTDANAAWKLLEAEHLAYRKQLGIDK